MREVGAIYATIWAVGKKKLINFSHYQDFISNRSPPHYNIISRPSCSTNCKIFEKPNRLVSEPSTHHVQHYKPISKHSIHRISAKTHILEPANHTTEETCNIFSFSKEKSLRIKTSLYSFSIRLDCLRFEFQAFLISTAPTTPEGTQIFRT